MSSKPTIATPLKRAEGLGSSHSGVHHWLALRISSMALIPLGIWFVVSVLRLAHSDHAALMEFFNNPINAVLMALVVGFSFHHTMLGLQEVIEDYVHCKIKKTTMLLLIRFGLLGLGAVTVLAIVKMHLAG